MFRTLSEIKSGRGIGSLGKTALALTIRICAFAILIAWFFISRDTNPKVDIPTPLMPSRNAYDAFNSAANAITDERKLSFAFAHSHAASKWNPDDREYTQQEKSALVRENAPALAKLRAGLSLPFLHPPVRSYSTVFRNLAQYRTLARVIVLEGRDKAAHGDWAGSAQSDLDAIQMGVACPRGAPTIGLLVGNACEAIAREPLWDAVDHLSGPQALNTGNRLHAIQMSRILYSQVMREEKWSMQAGLLEQFQQRNWQKSLVKVVMGDGAQPSSTLFFTSKRKIMGNLTSYMDQVIANADQPYSIKLPVMPPAKDPITSMLIPEFSAVKFKNTANGTETELLITALALRAYQAEHGGYPDSLPQLVPTYLTAVPPDPFSSHSTLQYRKTTNKYLLYSIGPDGKDDGGAPIVSKRGGRAKPSYAPQADGLGDIVAGGE